MVLIFIQSAQDKVFSCLLFTVLYTIISIISSTILKLHMGLVLVLDKICSHVFIGGYPFFYFYCAGMLKQNHWEQRPMCSTKKQKKQTKKQTNKQKKNKKKPSTQNKENNNIGRGHMGYRLRNVISDCRKWTLQLTLKRPKWRFIFYLDCFEDKHIDFLLQSVF